MAKPSSYQVLQTEQTQDSPALNFPILSLTQFNQRVEDLKALGNEEINAAIAQFEQDFSTELSKIMKTPRKESLAAALFHAIGSLNLDLPVIQWDAASEFITSEFISTEFSESEKHFKQKLVDILKQRFPEEEIEKNLKEGGEEESKERNNPDHLNLELGKLAFGLTRPLPNQALPNQDINYLFRLGAKLGEEHSKLKIVLTDAQTEQKKLDLLHNHSQPYKTARI